MTVLVRNRRPGRPRGFTLVELLVVVVIVILVSAVALPTVIPALTSRQVSEGARILQAAIAGARDAAIRANAPRGIRLLPDHTLSDFGSGAVLGSNAPDPGGRLTANRIVPIEPAPDLTDSSDQSSSGSASFVNVGSSSWSTGSPPAFPFPFTAPAGVYPFPSPTSTAPNPFNVLLIAQAINRNNNPNGIFNPPTNWFWNVRIGDRLRFQDSGRYYTVVGPMTQVNPEGFVNDGAADATPTLTISLGNDTATPSQQNPEYLFLVNGVDDNGDGFVDNGLDGIDNDANGLIDDMERSSGATVTAGEWFETETWLGAQVAANIAAQASSNPTPFRWTIARQPVPSPGAREVSLPAGATIDLTTWATTNERSRLPVNALNGTVDVLVNQAGQVIPTTFYSSPSSFSMAGSFFHFWIADRGDVTTPSGGSAPRLPVSTDAANLPATLPSTFLKKDRVLISLFARTGQVVTNSIENFDYKDVNRPFDDAQLGIREAK